MDIKMKCFYKRGQNECTNSAIYICANCQNQVFYCESHGEDHSIHTGHEIISIGNSGLSKFKKEIKACINNIAKNADAVISEIRRASLTAIITLKRVNKNVKNIEELALKRFDANRVSFLIEQAKLIDHVMNESPIQTSERLSSELANKERQINSLGTELKGLKNKLTERDSESKQMSQPALNKQNIIPAPQSVQPPMKVQPPAPMQSFNTIHQGTN